MPSSAKMRMKRKRRKRSEMMLRIELISEMTRLRSEDQYLRAVSYLYEFNGLAFRRRLVSE